MTNAQDRQKTIVDILNFLHAGGDFEQAKQMFNQAFDSVDVAEITTAERQLIANGLNPLEIQRLCNVHAAVFKGAIKNDQETPAFQKPGHPVNTFKLENTIIKSLIEDELLPCLKKWQQAGQVDDYLNRIIVALKDLQTIDKHYARKEQTLFPIMDKYGITAPPKVMWGVDDQIRAYIKQAYDLATKFPNVDKYDIEAAITQACQEVLEMIFKEEDIMLPMLDEVATPLDWQMVKEDEAEIGYTLIAAPLAWKPTQSEIDLAKKQPKSTSLAQQLNEAAKNLAAQDEQVKQTKTIASVKEQLNQKTLPDTAAIDLGSGSLTLTQLLAVFKTLPVDLTFVDETDHVRWFSDSPNRIFPRTKSVLGRAVVNCHPPKSVAQVEKILSDFHSGRQDQAEFWFKLHQENFIHIQYFALRADDGKYLGCLECSQDLTRLRALDGEKRLL